MATAIHTLVCGCLEDAVILDGHRPGCWMANAEAVAGEAITANNLRPQPGNSTVAVVTALAEAGYLSGITDDQALFGLLDYLADVELLATPAGV
jgi:hypothetical protein